MTGHDIEQLTGEVRGTFVGGVGDRETGVIILAGSSGRIDTGRARLFAEAGTNALALQWFGGENQPAGICEVELETFVRATDLMISRGCRRIVFIGTSKGAEAALLTSIVDERVNAVVAISPTSVVWGNIGAGIDGIAWPERSSWSFGGAPIEFVPADTSWTNEYRDGLVSYRSFFLRCLTSNPEASKRARIPIETSSADIILVAGGDDALWPSDVFASHLLESRRTHGKHATLIFNQEAGHRVLFPGETTPRSKLHAHGGNDEADRMLGLEAWQALQKLL